jgi:acyl-CoA thioester hydrolase
MPTLPHGLLFVRVYYEDTDFSGRVFHASYLKFLERGRTEWLRGLGFNQSTVAANDGIVFAVRRLQIEYMAPALMDDLLRVETEISELGRVSIQFHQRILRDQEPIVSAAVLVASIRARRPARLPESLLDRLRTFR